MDVYELMVRGAFGQRYRLQRASKDVQQQHFGIVNQRRIKPQFCPSFLGQHNEVKSAGQPRAQ